MDTQDYSRRTLERGCADGRIMNRGRSQVRFAAGMSSSPRWGTARGAIHAVSLALFAVAASAGSALANGGDECYSRTMITGIGLFDFDTYGMTTSSPTVPTSCLPNGVVKNDVWYEWLVPSDGDYKISTVGHTNVNTVLVAYANISSCSPTNPIACNDNAANCGPCCTQSRITLCGLEAGDYTVSYTHLTLPTIYSV